MKAAVPRPFPVVSRTFSSVGWTVSPTTLLTLRRVATLRAPTTIARMIAIRKSTVPAIVKLIIVTSRKSCRVSIPMMRYLRVGLEAGPPGRHRPRRGANPPLRRAAAHRHQRRRRLAPVSDAHRRPEPPLGRLAGDERQLLGDETRRHQLLPPAHDHLVRPGVHADDEQRLPPPPPPPPAAPPLAAPLPARR